MERATQQLALNAHDGERLTVGPALVRKLTEDGAGLERVLARRESEFGAALERDLFPYGAPARVLPSEVRRALARRLEGALDAFQHGSSPSQVSANGDVVAPLRAIAANVRTHAGDDEIASLLFPNGMPERVDATDLLRGFRAAASREQKSLVRVTSLVPTIGGWETLLQHEVAGRMVLVSRLWVVAVRWYALGAARAGDLHVLSFKHLLEKWQRTEKSMRALIDA